MTKMCVVALSAAAFLFASCAQDGFKDERFQTSVRNTQLTSPAVENITITPTSDKSRTIISWKVVEGASSYDCKVYDVTDETPVVLVDSIIDNVSFTWGNHTLHFAVLGVAVSMMAITGGETAILKATRRLGSLARIQIYTSIAAVILSVPLYYFFRDSGILPAILLIALSTMLATMAYSYSYYPLRLKIIRRLLSEGASMLKLGIAYVLAAAIGSGTEMLIRSFLNVEGSLNSVGLYNVGFMLTMTYAGMVFSAMETDYFPRLSAVGDDVEELNTVVNRQSEVTLLIVSPMLTMLMLLLPVLIPILFRSDFLPVVPMAQVVLLSMYIRSVYLPMAYTTLAKGDSLNYFLLEAAYAVLVVVFVVVGYRNWGLTGTGYALALANVCDFLMAYAYTSIRYHLRVSPTVMLFMGIQMPLGIGVYILTFVDNAVLYWGMGSMLCVVSLLISFYILRQKSSLWSSLKHKFLSRFGHDS